MQLDEAKHKFIQSWGSFGSQWGINRTMAQIHALFLITPDSMSTEEVMDALQISRGNANTNIRTLIDWGYSTKSLKLENVKTFLLEKKTFGPLPNVLLKCDNKKSYYQCYKF